MRLTIRHETVYHYQPAAPRAALRLKLFATDCATQTPVEWSLSVNGEPVRPMLNDAWGDAEALWFSQQPVAEVRVVAEGSVDTSDKAGIIGRLGRGRPAVFLRRTQLTEPSAEIAELAAGTEGEDDLSRLHALNEAVADAVAYRPGATGTATTAADALTLGAGVCQDLTHVFISAARTLGLPGRYVVGYLHDPETPLAETHAWAEAHVPGLGWVGFDPTHRVSPTDAYVRLCSGLDASDAAPLRGTIQGAAVDEAFSVAVEIGQAQQ